MSRKRGARYETLALNYLRDRGLRLLERNYRCKMGEIDLVMEDDETLVFVEVRFRESADFGRAAASVTPHKQRRVAKAAAHYLIRRGNQREPVCRFDVIGIDNIAGEPDIEWITSAFEAT